ncbi:peptidoglycan-binding domain-containing protein [Streptomyces physcomitrii]|uniref:Peptidoglycan-binding protein n=1 Tax=Streptomyces physcomitrii TaxID=2724184 RepID=A0ABX1H3Y3_9ACTN|nr:peptidoglycan-binding domain-containing protein [Streptomyces physcomitrii]NKI43074.1 peptidoglycan-binding protein [Streptomyces physcomitrii]
MAEPQAVESTVQMRAVEGAGQPQAAQPSAQPQAQTQAPQSSVQTQATQLSAQLQATQSPAQTRAAEHSAETRTAGPTGPAEPTGPTAEARAAERKEARAAEAATASDYTPLRVRPYVSLSESDEPPHTGVVSQPLPPLATPGGAAARQTAGQAGVLAAGGRRRWSGRRLGLVAALGTTAGAVVLGLLVTDALSGGSEDDEAIPEARSSRAQTYVPDPTPSSSAPASPSATPSKKPSPTRTTAPPPPPPRPKPTTSRSAMRPKPVAVPVLRAGSRGPEVAELQRRLRQAYLYAGPYDGVYDTRVENAVRGYQFTRGISSDPSGVYGTATRKSLEGNTKG